jgi:hypothetical protein
MSYNAESLLRDVQEFSPEVADSLEVAAIIESFGYNDRLAREYGFSDVFSMAEDIFLRFPQRPAEKRKSATGNLFSTFGSEIKIASRKFSLGLAYSIPWMALLAVEYLYPDALQVSPEFGGAMSLALIASLITTGGLIQMISRSAGFYFGLQEPFVGRRWCLFLLRLGFASSVVCALLGLFLGMFWGIFPAQYLMIAAVNYLTLSFLWMLCAVLSAQKIGWYIPLSFLLAGLTLLGLNMVIHCSTTVIFLVSPLAAVVYAAAGVLFGFHKLEKGQKKQASAQPRFGVVLTSLVPYYAYGTLYFAFLFADRLTAGTAIPWASGLSFGIDSGYKRGMDIVLLAFLITAALVEYLSDSYLRFLSRLAAELPQDGGHMFSARLRKRRSIVIGIILVFFVAVALVDWFVFMHGSGAAASPRLLETAIFGGLGYLMLTLALFETIILASVNAITLALRAVSLGLCANFVAGYFLSHEWGVQYAAAGLCLGSSILLWQCHATVGRVLKNPGYYHSIA